MKNAVGKGLADNIRNSRLHLFLATVFEKFEMEGLSLSYSQCGEDLILKTIFGKNKRNGFYVDIGCNNPIQKSNTFKLYLKGWRGICADGNAALMKKFKKIRSRDICLNAIVSDSSRDMVFYQDDTRHELSSVDPGQGNVLKGENRQLKELKVRSTTLKEIFEEHLGSRPIDLLCVDVEQHDLEVLKGNDYTKFRPEIICVEFDSNIGHLKGSELDLFLTGNNYEVLAISAPNVFYKNKAS